VRPDKEAAVIRVEQNCVQDKNLLLWRQQGDGDWEINWDLRDERDHLELATGVIGRDPGISPSVRRRA
jgi:hypothetical protein